MATTNRPQSASARPRIPDPPTEIDQSYMQQLVRAIKLNVDKNNRSGSTKYLIDNFQPTYRVDLATDSQETINNFIATVLADLIQRGVLA